MFTESYSSRPGGRKVTVSLEGKCIVVLDIESGTGKMRVDTIGEDVLRLGNPGRFYLLRDACHFLTRRLDHTTASSFLADFYAELTHLINGVPANVFASIDCLA